MSREVERIPDVLADPEYSQTFARAGGWRSLLGVPMLRDGKLIGVIGIGRSAPGAYADQHVELLKTFADQAVIAIENVRLFNALQARTAELTQSVRELKALGEIGQAVSSTLDLKTVLSTIVSRATGLAAVDRAAIYEYDESREQFYLHTSYSLPEDLIVALRSSPIRKGDGALGRLAVTGEPVEVRDIADKTVYQSRVREILLRHGCRSLLALPLLRENSVLGGLVVVRNQVRGIRSEGRRSPEDFRDAVRPGHPECAAVPRDRRQEPARSRPPAATRASSSPTCPTSCARRSTRSSVSPRCWSSGCSARSTTSRRNTWPTSWNRGVTCSRSSTTFSISRRSRPGRMELEPSDFDLRAVIDNTLILVRERAHRRGVALAFSADEHLGVIRADERKVKQVLLNLLSNALKFTPEGGRIEVRAAVRNAEAEIAVTDTGVGIAPEDQAAVFEEFRQVGAAAKKVEGTGLGLAISRKFIALHGGRLWVESQVGKGSTFTFTLPRL